MLLSGVVRPMSLLDMLHYNNIKRYLLCLGLGFGLLLPEAQAQSGWTKKKGEYFAQASISLFSSDKYYNVDGVLQNSTKGTYYTSYALNLYGEYGIADRWTALLNAPIFQINQLTTTEAVAGTGNIRLGIKYQLLKSVPLSFSIEADVPTNNGENIASSKTEILPGIREMVNLPTSDGELNFWNTLAFSKSSNSGKYYGTLFTAINARTKGLSWQSHSGIEVGHLLFDKLWAIGRLQVQKSLSKEISQAPFLYGEGTEYTGYGISLFYKTAKKWRFSASYFDFSNAIVKLQNLYDGPSISLGVGIEY